MMADQTAAVTCQECHQTHQAAARFCPWCGATAREDADDQNWRK